MSADRPLSPDLRDALASAPDAAELERVWHLLGDDLPAPESPDQDWHIVRRRLQPSRTRAVRRAGDRTPRRSSRTFRARWTAAASVLVAAAALAIWVFAPVTHRAPLGDTLAVTLPDGSTVTLNSGASIEHARFFASARAVSLTGEAFFDVRKGTTPFLVSTHNAQIEVLGTAFNVRAWDAQTTVALVEGRVEVTGDAGVTEELSPGEVVLIAGPEPAPERVQQDVARAAAWREGSLAFDGLPLGAVLAEVERRYAVSFVAEPGTPLGSNVSAFYTARPVLDSLLGDLGAAAGVRFVPAPEGYRIQPAPRLARPSAPAPPTVTP